MWWRSVVVFVLLIGGGLLSSGAAAGERVRPIRIGVLTSSWGPTPQVAGLRDGLVALGYREPEQVEIGVRFTQGDVAALPAAAHELVQYGLDLLFTDGELAAKAAQGATNRIPIVFGGPVDPLGAGLIQSFARPGGNITGVAALDLELGPKRLEVFKQILPELKRLLYPYDANNASALAALRMYRDAARRLEIDLVETPLQTGEEAQATLAHVRRGEVDGILQPHTTALNIPGLVLEAASREAIPLMSNSAWMVEHGGLASYGPDLYETGRQAARLVDKILKGMSPAMIPVEVNPKIEFIINLKVAHALGLTIAPVVLFRADRLIR